MKKHPGIPQEIEDQDPLEFLLTYHKDFPILSNMLRAHLSVPATSNPTECAFSVGDRVMSNHYSSIDPKKLEALLGLFEEPEKYHLLFCFSLFLCFKRKLFISFHFSSKKKSSFPLSFHSDISMQQCNVANRPDYKHSKTAIDTNIQMLNLPIYTNWHVQNQTL